jgi:hypothetical protein
LAPHHDENWEQKPRSNNMLDFSTSACSIGVIDEVSLVDVNLFNSFSMPTGTLLDNVWNL